MCAHTVCKVTLPRIPLKNCDTSFICQLYRRYPPDKHKGGMLFPLRALPLPFTLCLENSWEKWANNCPFSVFFVEKVVYYQ